MQVVAAFLLVLCHLAIGHAWNCTENRRMPNPLQIDAGLGQVVATDRSHHAYFLSGSNWHQLPSVSSGHKHISVGPAGLWAVSRTDMIYKYVGGMWKSVPGRLKQVDAGGNAIVGANGADVPYCLRSSSTIGYTGSDGVPWTELQGRVIHYSCGPTGCWGVNSANMVYIMRSVNPTTCTNGGWLHVPGVSLTMIEVGTDGSVFGVTTAGQVYQRVGISGDLPEGSSWSQISVCLDIKHVTYDLAHLWLISKSGVVLQCAR